MKTANGSKINPLFRYNILMKAYPIGLMASEIVFGSLASGGCCGCCCCCKMGLPNKAATLALALNVSIFETVEEEGEMIVVPDVGVVVKVVAVAAEFGNGCTCSLVMASTTGASNDDSFFVSIVPCSAIIKGYKVTLILIGKGAE